jgi:helicase
MHVPIPDITNDPSIDIALDTVNKKKQALVFCNTRRSAESTAEKIGKEIKGHNEILDDLGNKILKVLSSPTKQCRRLAGCVRKGTAFHHAGLASEQRKLIEDNFRKGIIKIICSTPTLAMGINLPAFRAILKDLKRYGGRWGLKYIQTLEYHQMAGRAGRPDFNDKYGEAICIAKNQEEAEEILEKFIKAGPEKIYSKLAVEPVLRTYCLSLVATGFCKSKNTLIEFFEKTFYGYQYGDMRELEIIIEKILGYLEEWEFIKYSGQANDFVSASDLGSDKIEATKLGERVAQLYLDPYTAHFIITCLRRATQKTADEFSYIQMASSTLELRPLNSVRIKEVEMIENELSELSTKLIIYEPSVFEPEYDDFLKSMKTAFALLSWMDEKNEDDILEEFNIAPGELHVKRNLIDWILFATEEISILLNFRDLIKIIKKTRYRLDKGVKEELIPLVRLKNIGRVRARTLYRNGIKDIGDLKKTDLTKLTQLIGLSVAKNLKKQLGQEVEEVKKGKRKGQTSLLKQVRD